MPARVLVNFSPIILGNLLRFTLNLNFKNLKRMVAGGRFELPTCGV